MRPSVSRFAADARGLSPVIGKALELSLVLLFVGLLSTALFGGVVPSYRTAAADEVADRTVARVAGSIEASLPAAAASSGAGESWSARTTRELALPARLRGVAYTLRVDREADAWWLVLDHPNEGLESRTVLALPPATDSATGAVTSTADPVVVVAATPDGVSVRILARDTHPEGLDA